MTHRPIRPKPVSRLRAAVTLLVLCLAATTAATAKADPVDTYLKAEMARNHIPGLSVAVLRDGKILKIKAYGRANLEWDTATTPDTAFQLASATKPITATAIMLLVQEGKLSLDDPIRRHLPDSPPAWNDITLRHLANHTSGIPDDLGSARVETAADGFAAAAKLPLEYAPGTRSSYGITGYIVLQHIIERVTGKSFDTFLQERLFAPLGMENTRFDHATQSGPARALCLVPRRSGVYEWSAAEDRQKSFLFPFPSHSYSAGGLYASTSDLARWIAALDKGRLLTPASQEQMWTKGKLQNGAQTSFALGWVTGKYRGQRTVGHSGGPALADILRFPDEKLTIIVLANQQKMYPYLAQGVADLYVKVPTAVVTEPAFPDNDPKMTQALQELLQAFAEGKVNPGLFAPQARQPLVGAIEGFVMPWFRALGAPHSLTLIEEKNETEPQRRVRRYRVWYNKKSVLWKFELDKEGQIVGMEPTPE